MIIIYFFTVLFFLTCPAFARVPDEQAVTKPGPAGINLPREEAGKIDNSPEKDVEKTIEKPLTIPEFFEPYDKQVLYPSFINSKRTPAFRRTYAQVQAGIFKNFGNEYGIPDLEVEEKIPPEPFDLRISKDKKPLNNKKSGKIWAFIKGKPINNSVLLGMFSHHTSKNDEHNETHNLIGLDYKGYSIGTFKNSFSDQTFYAGISRKLYEKKLTEKFKFDIKYKLIGLHGYGDRYPNIGGITPVIMPVIGFTRNNTGIDFIIIPDDKPTFTFNFRYDIPKEKL